jgi:hypothetical protein
MAVFNISPEAWVKLLNIAIEYKYVSPHVFKAQQRSLHNTSIHGMGDFLDALALPDTRFFDNRDPEFKEADLGFLENGHAPHWIDCEYRMRRKFSVSNETIHALSEKALALLIVSLHPYVEASNVALLLEALGENQLTFTGLLINPTPHQFQKPRKEWSII